MTVVVLSFVAFLYTAYDCVQLYMKDVTARAESGRLPSITVCNVNPLRSVQHVLVSVLKESFKLCCRNRTARIPSPVSF